MWSDEKLCLEIQHPNEQNERYWADHFLMLKLIVSSKEEEASCAGLA